MVCHLHFWHMLHWFFLGLFFFLVEWSFTVRNNNFLTNIFIFCHTWIKRCQCRIFFFKFMGMLYPCSNSWKSTFLSISSCHKTFLLQTSQPMLSENLFTIKHVLFNKTRLISFCWPYSKCVAYKAIVIMQISSTFLQTFLISAFLEIFFLQLHKASIWFQ